MRYLVTGGTGFIGRALCAGLSADGHDVVVLSRAARPQPGVRVVNALQALDHADAVINLQGENLATGRWTAARKRAFRDSRVDFTDALVAWMCSRARPPTVLVSGSAIGWYGDRGDEALTETSAAGTDFAAQLCIDWENAALAAETLGVRVCRVRTGIVLDTDGGALAQMLTPFRLGLGGPLGNGQQWMSWITRSDLVRLLRWLVDHGAHGVFNGTAPEPVRNREFARLLGQALRRPAILPMPALALRALFGEMSGLLLGSQRVLPAAAQAAGFRFEHPSLAAALESMLGRAGAR